MLTRASAATSLVRLERSARRYELCARVEIVRAGRCCAVGDLINISTSGAAFSAYTPLEIGGSYDFIIRRIADLPGQVVRCFGTSNYGIRFKIGYEQSLRLARRIEDEFQRQQHDG